jgi:hypothetical protein
VTYWNVSLKYVNLKKKNPLKSGEFQSFFHEKSIVYVKIIFFRSKFLPHHSDKIPPQETLETVALYMGIMYIWEAACSGYDTQKAP